MTSDDAFRAGQKAFSDGLTRRPIDNKEFISAAFLALSSQDVMNNYIAGWEEAKKREGQPPGYEWVGDSLENQSQPWDSPLDVEVSCGAWCQGGSAILNCSLPDRQFIAEAFNVRKDTGKTAGQLQREVEALRASLKDMVDAYTNVGNHMSAEERTAARKSLITAYELLKVPV